MEQVIAVLHRYLGELLMTVAIVGVLAAVFGRAPSGALQRTALVLGRIFAVALSVQWVLGIVNFVFAQLRGAPPSWWHPIVMTLAVSGAHIFMGRVRKSPDQARFLLIAMYLVTYILIVIGVRAI